MIVGDVGKIESIAPVSAPNRYHPGFTDGYFCEMNLEVIGAGGRGVLTLPYFEVSSDGSISAIGDEATWRFREERHLIHKSGKSYLGFYGLEKLYNQLLALDKSQSEMFVDLFRQLEKTFNKPHFVRAELVAENLRR